MAAERTNESQDESHHSSEVVPAAGRLRKYGKKHIGWEMHVCIRMDVSMHMCTMCVRVFDIRLVAFQLISCNRVSRCT